MFTTLHLLKGRMARMATSLVVRQFVAVLRGEVAPHAPENERKTLLMVQSSKPCLACGSEEGQDVVIFDGGRWEVCRCCQAERMVG
jgi:hypothetical protein